MPQSEDPILTPAQIVEQQKAAVTIPTDPIAKVEALNKAAGGEDATGGEDTNDPDYEAFQRAIGEARAHGDTTLEASAEDNELADLLAQSRIELDPTAAHAANPLLHPDPPSPDQAETATPPPAEPEQAPPAPLSAEEQEQRALAFGALRRAQLDLGDFRDEKTALERGLALAEQQKNTDGLIGDFRQKLSQSPQQAADPGPIEAPAPGQTAAALTLEGIDKPLVAAFTEQFGEDAGKAVGEVFPKVFGAMESRIAALQSENESMRTKFETGLENVVAMLETRAMDETRAAWTRAGAALSDESWKAVQHHYAALAQSGHYQGLEGVGKAMDHAYRIVFSSAPPEASAVDPSVNKARENGSMTPPVRQQEEPPKTQKGEEIREDFQGFLKAIEMSERASQASGGIMV